MNARRFDALTVAMTSGARRASRRRVLRGLAALAALGLAPGVARAFDGGPAPVQPPSAASPAPVARTAPPARFVSTAPAPPASRRRRARHASP